MQYGAQFGRKSSEVLGAKSQFCSHPENATSSRTLNRVVDIQDGFDMDVLKDGKCVQAISESRTG